MTSQPQKRKRGRPKGSKNKPKLERTPVKNKSPLNDALDSIMDNEIEDIQSEEKKTIPIEGFIEKEEKNKSTHWVNEATRTKKDILFAVEGLKKLREKLDLVIQMTESAKGLQEYLDAVNGGVNGTIGNIQCDEKNGWMDLTYCEHNCKSKCYKYNTGRWICYLLRCNDEKITSCDERNHKCNSFSMIMGFALRYVGLANRIVYGATDGNKN